MTPTPTLQQLLQQVAPQALNQQGLLLETLGQLNSAAPPPWYLRILIALSAWLAALLFLVFLFLGGWVQEERSAWLVGLLFIGAALVLHRLNRRQEGLFLSQFALAFSMAGHVLFISGLYEETDSVLLTCAGILLLELVLLLAYKEFLHRLLAVQLACLSLAWLCMESPVPELLHPLIISLAVLSLLAWHWEAWHQPGWRQALYLPLAYGCASSLVAILLLSLLSHGEYARLLSSWWLSSVGLGIILLFLQQRYLQRLHLRLSYAGQFLLVGGTLAGIVILAQTPGVIAALLLLLLGFERQRWPLVGAAILFALLFFSFWYYQLALSLLEKSIALTLGGVLVLLIYVIWRHYPTLWLRSMEK